AAWPRRAHGHGFAGPAVLDLAWRDFVVRALIYGASGGLALALASELLALGWAVDGITRPAREAVVQLAYAPHGDRARVFVAAEGYARFVLPQDYGAVFLTQALFEPGPLAEMTPAQIEA